MQAPTATKRLFFAVVGERTVASVSVKDDDPIEDLKAAIAQKRRYDFPSDDLTLFTTKRSGSTDSPWLIADSKEMEALQKAPVSDQTKQKYLTREYELNPATRVRRHFANVSEQDEVIHVLVWLPEQCRASQSRKRSPESLDASSPPTTRSRTSPPASIHDSTERWKDRFYKTFLSASTLPPVSELRAFVEEPLPEKISIASASLDYWRLATQVEALNKLFVVDDNAPCTQFFLDVVRPAQKPPRADHSEASFIPHWGSLIQKPLEETLPNLCIDRDTTRDSSTATKRPDFVCTLHRVCVFRGEEKNADADISLPEGELRIKLIWSYGSAPYMLAYATSGYKCCLYALVTADGESVDTVEIASFRTEFEEDRVRLLLAILQLMRLFEAIVRLCPAAARDEYFLIKRSNGVVIRLKPLCVTKCFPKVARWAGIGRHLEKVYRVIRTSGVPHTDVLTKSDLVENKFTFRPRGTSQPPRNLDELFIAIGQVLECLVALHESGWMHRDLRWDNVLKRRDLENQWFVIDFVDAAPSPKQNDVHLETLNRDGHAPEISVEGGSHSTAVDLWSVGALINACYFDEDELSERPWIQQWRDCEERMAFLFRLLDTEPSQRPSASEALAELKRLQTAKRSR